MNIHDLKTQPIERVENASSDDVARIIAQGRRPVIFSGLDKDFEFLRKMNLDFFEKLNANVPVQKPESDGVNYFVKYFRMPLAEFVQRIRAGEGLYIGARQFMENGGVRSSKDGLAELYDHVKPPKWIDQARVWTANLWIGAGNNRTLLHYDPWDGFLMLGAGKKEFLIFPGSETHRMYPVGILDYPKLMKGAVLHSRIRPLDVQKQYQKEFSKVEGFRGTITAGEMIHIPAGYWHYVESTDLNIGVNFFVHFKDSSLNFEEPLRSYWLMYNVTLWPIRWFEASRRFASRVYHLFVPRKTAA